MLSYVITADGTISGSANGKLFFVRKDSQMYAATMSAVKTGDADNVLSAITWDTYVSDWSSGKLQLVSGDLFYDGHKIEFSFANRLVRFLREGVDCDRLVKYIHRLMLNPQPRCVKTLDLLINRPDAKFPLPLLPDGRFVAYKRVQDNYTDFFTGKVYYPPRHVKYANDHRVNDRKWLEMQPGEPVGMPRWEADDNFQLACSKGYHAGLFEYIETFHPGQGHIIQVAVCPSQVISVPEDAAEFKFRTHHLEVLDEIDEPTVMQALGHAPPADLPPTPQPNIVVPPSQDDDDDDDDWDESYVEDDDEDDDSIEDLFDDDDDDADDDDDDDDEDDDDDDDWDDDDDDDDDDYVGGGYFDPVDNANVPTPDAEVDTAETDAHSAEPYPYQVDGDALQAESVSSDLEVGDDRDEAVAHACAETLRQPFSHDSVMQVEQQSAQAADEPKTLVEMADRMGLTTEGGYLPSSAEMEAAIQHVMGHVGVTESGAVSDCADLDVEVRLFGEFLRGVQQAKHVLDTEVSGKTIAIDSLTGAAEPAAVDKAAEDAEEADGDYDSWSLLTVKAFWLPCLPTRKGLRNIQKEHLRAIVKECTLAVARGQSPTELADSVTANTDVLSVEESGQLLAYLCGLPVGTSRQVSEAAADLEQRKDAEFLDGCARAGAAVGVVPLVDVDLRADTKRYDVKFVNTWAKDGGQQTPEEAVGDLAAVEIRMAEHMRQQQDAEMAALDAIGDAISRNEERKELEAAEASLQAVIAGNEAFGDGYDAAVQDAKDAQKAADDLLAELVTDFDRLLPAAKQAADTPQVSEEEYQRIMADRQVTIDDARRRMAERYRASSGSEKAEALFDAVMSEPEPEVVVEQVQELKEREGITGSPVVLVKVGNFPDSEALLAAAAQEPEVTSEVSRPATDQPLHTMSEWCTAAIPYISTRSLREAIDAWRAKLRKP
jgi:hypothetical protein